MFLIIKSLLILGLNIIKRSGIVARKDVKGPITDNALNNINHNFIELYNEFVSAGMNAQEALNKVNQMVGIADNALKVAKQSDLKSDDTQKQLDDIILKDGNDIAEVVQARGGELLLKDRLNKTDSQLEEAVDELFKSSLVNRKKGGFKVWWIDDDGHKGVYTKLAPILRKYGIKMSSAVITNRPHGFPLNGLPAYDSSSQFMSYEEMKELHEEGIVEFIPHSHTHDNNYRYTDMTLKEIHEDMSTCKIIMRQLGWNYKDIAFPFGAHNDTVREVARQYFRSAIDIRGGIVIPPINQFAIPRLGMDSRDAEDIIDEIDNAHENNTLIIIMSHVDQYGGLDDTKMKKVIEHVLSLGGEFVTGEEAINNYGNLLQIGDDSISFDGSIHSNRLGKTTVTEDNEFLASNVPSDFETGITLTKIDQSSPNNTSGLPLDLYGTLITIKSSHLNNWTHQMFYAGYRNLTAYRHAISGNNWSDWHVDYSPAGQGILPDSTPPKDYPKGVTTTTISNQQATETPFNHGGVIKTTKTHDSNYVWTYQEFFNVVKNAKYHRRAVSDDEWTDWIKDKDFYNVTENEINGSMLESEFENGITHGYIRGNSEGLPNGKQSGNIVTYKEPGGAVRSYQTLRVSGSEELYIRGGSSDGSWRSWKKLVTEEV